jgi:hypothetical protein
MKYNSFEELRKTYPNATIEVYPFTTCRGYTRADVWEKGILLAVTYYKGGIA